jgi:hypothetical protein
MRQYELYVHMYTYINTFKKCHLGGLDKEYQDVKHSACLEKAMESKIPCLAKGNR